MVGRGCLAVLEGVGDDGGSGSGGSGGSWRYIAVVTMTMVV